MGHVCSSGGNVLRCSLLPFFFFVCKLCSASVNQFNLSCTSQRLSSHCMQDDTNAARLREEVGGAGADF